MPEALRTLQRIIELLSAAQIAAETGELARLIQLHNRKYTPSLEQVLSALLNVEPDCRAAAGYSVCGTENKTETVRPANGEHTLS